MEFLRSFLNFVVPTGVFRMLKFLSTRASSFVDRALTLSLTSAPLRGPLRNMSAGPAPLQPPEYALNANQFLVQPGSGQATFMHDDSLPSLPVPKLEQTLQRYLDSVKPILNETELAHTTRLVKKFGSGIGKKLHEKLLKRAAERRNWLDEWWLNEAYLKVRYPLAPLCNPSEIGVCTDHYWPPRSGTQLERLALHMHFTARVWLHLRKEEIAPEGRAPVKVTMNQLRNLCNCVQLPGEHQDSLHTYFKTEREGPGYSHVVVLYNGHVTVLHILDEEGRPHSAPELQNRLRELVRRCEKPGPGLGALTALPRTDWWRLRRHLSSVHGENASNLDVISTAICAYCIDMSERPYTNAECLSLSLGGDPTCRWFDKSINYIISPSGVMTSNTAHSPADGMAMITVNRLMQIYVYKCRGVWDGDSVIRKEPRMKTLHFHVDDTLLDAVEQGRTVYQQSVSSVSMFVPTFYLFGKDLLKSFRVHPDTFVQMALQLAYYRLHGRGGATYETATTRQFYRGRTETVRSCTEEAMDFCATMADSSKTSKERYSALKKAVDKHNWLMRECCNAQGCDRHLMGLRLIAREAGMDDPDIYSDPAWKRSGGDGSFVLSTSLSGYGLALGGMPPMVEHGYGLFYRIHDAKISLIMTSFKTCAETNERDLYGHLQTSFLQMRDVIAENQPPYAKL